MYLLLQRRFSATSHVARHGLLLLLVLLPATATAQDAALGLNEAVTLALQQAPEVTAGEAGVSSAQLQLRSAGRLPDPQLIAGIDNVPVTGPDAYSASADFMTMRKLGVMQEFPNAQKRRQQRDRARLEIDVWDAQLQETRLTIARDVAQAWIAVATSDQVLAQLRALQTVAELQAQAVRAGLGAGSNSGAEALAARMAVVRLGNRVLAQQADSQVARAALARWIGTDAVRPLAAPPQLDALPMSAEHLLASSHLHASILQLDERIAAAHADVALASAEKRPDWSAELTYGQRGAPFSDMVSLQFRIELPVFSRNRQDPLVQARNADLHRMEAGRAAELRMHEAELQGVLARWQSLGAQLERYEQALLPLSEEGYRASLAAYAAGSGDLPAVLDAILERGDLLVEQAGLLNERGKAWAYLNFLESGSLDSRREQ